jgi:hypothetical protein
LTAGGVKLDIPAIPDGHTRSVPGI